MVQRKLARSRNQEGSFPQRVAPLVEAGNNVKFFETLVTQQAIATVLLKTKENSQSFFKKLSIPCLGKAFGDIKQCLPTVYKKYRFRRERNRIATSLERNEKG